MTSFLLATTLATSNQTVANQQIATTNSPFLVERDPKASAILQSSLRSMGASIPLDTAATGAITIVAGTKVEAGTITIRLRQLDQSLEHIVTEDRDEELVYSRDFAVLRERDSVRDLPLERAATSHSFAFPLLTIAVMVSPDWAFRYVALEDEDSAAVHHIRCWNTFASKAKFAPLAEFSVRDIWIDAASSLPRRVAYEVREANGPEEPRIRMEVSFADYRNVNGVLFPFRIEKVFNGTPWTTITIQNVSLNTGLNDADFSVR